MVGPGTTEGQQRNVGVGLLSKMSPGGMGKRAWLLRTVYGLVAKLCAGSAIGLYWKGLVPNAIFLPFSSLATDSGNELTVVTESKSNRDKV